MSISSGVRSLSLQNEQANFASSAGKDWVRGVALGVFMLAHMQDIAPILCPISLGLVGIAFLPDVIIYRRLPFAFLPAVAFTLYMLLLLFIHHNVSDGTASTLLFTSARYYYMFFCFIAFAHLRPTARFEPILFNAALFVTAVLCALCLFSFFVKPIAFGGASLSTNGFVTGLLGANGGRGDVSATGQPLARTSKNAMALALGAILTMVAAAFFHAFKRATPQCVNRWTPFLLAPVFVGFVLTKSRGCMLAFAVVTAVVSVAMVRRNPRWHSLLICGAVLFVLAGCFAVATRNPRGSEDNIWTRFELWERAARIFAESPIVGVGIGSFEQVNVRLQTIVPHLLAVRTSGNLASGDYHGGADVGASTLNSYIQLLLDFGLLGSGLYVLWIWQAVRLGRQFARPAAELGRGYEMVRQHATWNATVVLLSLVFVGVQSLTETCVLMGPNGQAVFAACFGRLVAQGEVLRWWKAGSVPAPFRITSGENALAGVRSVG